MGALVLIFDNVMHHVAEAELAGAGPLTEALAGPLQHASSRLDVEPRPANDDFLVQRLTGELRFLTADPLIPSEHFVTRTPGVPLFSDDPRRTRKTQPPGRRTDRLIAYLIASSEFKSAATAFAATRPFRKLAIKCDRHRQSAQAMGAANEPHDLVTSDRIHASFPLRE
jgi:hypothetical protein